MELGEKRRIGETGHALADENGESQLGDVNEINEKLLPRDREHLEQCEARGTRHGD